MVRVVAVVNIDLLLDRMSIIGLPEDLIGLVGIWLKERSMLDIHPLHKTHMVWKV